MPEQDRLAVTLKFGYRIFSNYRDDAAAIRGEWIFFRDTGTGGAPLTGTTWRAVSVGGIPIRGTRTEVTFGSDCRYSYEVANAVTSCFNSTPFTTGPDGRFFVGPSLTEVEASPPTKPSDPQSWLLHSGIGNAKRFAVGANELRFEGDDPTKTILFRKPSAAGWLADTSWRNPTTGSVVNFAEDGKVKLITSCGTYFSRTIRNTQTEVSVETFAQPAKTCPSARRAMKAFANGEPIPFEPISWTVSGLSFQRFDLAVGALAGTRWKFPQGTITFTSDGRVLGAVEQPRAKWIFREVAPGVLIYGATNVSATNEAYWTPIFDLVYFKIEGKGPGRDLVLLTSDGTEFSRIREQSR